MMASCNVLGAVRIYEAPDVVDASRWNLIHELQAFHTRCGCVTWSLSRMHRPLIAVGSDEKKAGGKERVVIYENIDGLRKWHRIHSLVFDLPCPITDLKWVRIFGSGTFRSQTFRSNELHSLNCPVFSVITWLFQIINCLRSQKEHFYVHLIKVTTGNFVQKNQQKKFGWKNWKPFFLV